MTTETEIKTENKGFYRESVKRAVYKYRQTYPEKYKEDQKRHQKKYYEQHKEELCRKAREKYLLKQQNKSKVDNSK